MAKVSSSSSPSPSLIHHPLSSHIRLLPPTELAASWILEFILRQPIPDKLAHEIFLSLPFSSPSPSLHPHLRKTLLLHRLSCDIRCRSLSDSTLHSLELMEELDRLRGAAPSPHLKAAYCAAAVACTAAALQRSAGDFSDAVERIWMARIADLVRSEEAAGLVSQELVEWGKRMERWRSTEGECEKLLDRKAEEAVRVVGDYMDSALKEMGPPFLEIAAAEVLENRMDSNGSAEMEGDDLRGVAKIYSCFGRLEEKCKGLEDDGILERSGILEETWKDLNDAGVSRQDTTDHSGGGGSHILDTGEVRKVKDALKKSCFEKQMLPEQEAIAASVLASMAGGNVFLNETAKSSSMGNTVLPVPPVDMVAGVSAGVDSRTGALEKEKCNLVPLRYFVRRKPLNFKPLEGHNTVKECNKDAEPSKHGDIVDHHSLFERNSIAHTREMTPNTRFNCRRGHLKKQVPIQEVTTPTPTTSTSPLTPTTNQSNSTPPLTTTTNPSTLPPPLITTTTTSPAFAPPLTPTTTQLASDHSPTTTTPPPQYQQLPSYAFPTLPFTYPPQYPPTPHLPSSGSIIPPHNHPFVHPTLYTYPPYYIPPNIGMVSTSIPLMQSSFAPYTQSSPNLSTQSPHVTPTHESQEEPNPSNGKKLIEPLGNGFSDQTAIRSLKVIIKSKFDAPYLSWKKIPIKVRDTWFQKFEKSYFWLPSHHHKIRAIFEKRCAARLKDILGDIRGAEEKPDWLTEMVWSGLRTQWSTPEYVNKRKQYKRNRASNCGGLGSSLHTGGSISHAEHSKRLKNLMGRDPSLSELFTRTHQRKKDKAWVDPRSEQIFNNFMRLHEQQSSQGSTNESPQSEFQMWTHAVGGVKKGHIYGLGSEGHVLADTHQDKYSGSSGLDEHIEKIVSQKVATLTTQFQSQLEQNQQTMNQLYQQLSSRPSQGQHIPQSSVEHIGKDIRHGHIDENEENTEDEDTKDEDTGQ